MIILCNHDRNVRFVLFTKTSMALVALEDLRHAPMPFQRLRLYDILQYYKISLTHGSTAYLSNLRQLCWIEIPGWFYLSNVFFKLWFNFNREFNIALCEHGLLSLKYWVYLSQDGSMVAMSNIAEHVEYSEKNIASFNYKYLPPANEVCCEGNVFTSPPGGGGLYPSMHWVGDVSQHALGRGSVSARGCLPGGGGVCSGKVVCLPRGRRGGVGPEADTPPNQRQTLPRPEADTPRL